MMQTTSKAGHKFPKWTLWIPSSDSNWFDRMWLCTSPAKWPRSAKSATRSPSWRVFWGPAWPHISSQQTKRLSTKTSSLLAPRGKRSPQYFQINKTSHAALKTQIRFESQLQTSALQEYWVPWMKGARNIKLSIARVPPTMLHWRKQTPIPAQQISKVQRLNKYANKAINADHEIHLHFFLQLHTSLQKQLFEPVATLRFEVPKEARSLWPASQPSRFALWGPQRSAAQSAALGQQSVGAVHPSACLHQTCFVMNITISRTKKTQGGVLIYINIMIIVVNNQSKSRVVNLGRRTISLTGT